MHWNVSGNKSFTGLLLVLPFVILASGFFPTSPMQKGENGQTMFQRFDFLTATSGWVLLDRQLFWTSDAGSSWDEIGPSIPPDASVNDIDFIDPDTGWLLWTTTNLDGSANFTLAHTNDHGKSWEVMALDLFELGEIPAQVEGATMGWFDAQSGWIATRQSTSSNFSLGTLFVTSDGGDSWTRSKLPVADRVTFPEPQIGWAVGGPTGDQIFNTQDGGLTWRKISIDLPSNSSSTVYQPFYSNGRGMLVVKSSGSKNSLIISTTESSLERWKTQDQVPLNSETGMIALSILDARNLVATIPGTNSIVRMSDDRLSVVENKDGSSASVVDLDMISLDEGWARSVMADCTTVSSSDDGSASVSCTSSTRLLHTNDGGATWQALQLPLTDTNFISPDASEENRSFTMNALPNSGRTEVFIGQGFDKCEIPTLTELQAWWDNSPYKTVNLYIGGISRACSNEALTSSYIEQLYHQGWKFIPTWVGPQAPCTSYNYKMSYDATIAHNQGVDEADLAVERLAELGLTFPDKTGAVIYYDIEYYGTNTACREAVNAFMNGWVSQIRARGNLAGAYGSTLCDTGLSDFFYIENQPDVIWPARWYHNLGEGYYDPNATVWNLGKCIPNTAWADHQRIRQYEGDHYETWGDLTLGIDSNVLEGVVAIPYVPPMVKSITRTDADPTNADTVGFAITFTETISGLDTDDLIPSTTGLSGASITNVSGSNQTYLVTVHTGSGNGTIRLDLVDDDSIKDADNLPLGGTGTGNGSFTIGEAYSIVKDTTFADAPVVYWAYSYIEQLYNAGITGGCSISPPLYCPESPVTRAQMAVFLLKGIHGSSYSPPAAGSSTGFADVPTSYWAAAWIKQLAVEGITGGCGGGNFCPDTSVTRAQMAVFLLKSKHGVAYNPPAATGVFTDVPVGYWADKWIEQLAAEGITGGCSPGIFCPDNPVTRAQMAVFLVKTFNLP